MKCVEGYLSCISDDRTQHCYISLSLYGPGIGRHGPSEYIKWFSLAARLRHIAPCLTV